jgi:hypothetical protein
MSYSCSDFHDSITRALKVDVSDAIKDGDRVQVSADLVLQEIERLQAADQRRKTDTDEFALATRHWPLIDRINKLADGEGWCLMVCGDGMVVVDIDRDAAHPQHDPYSYVERLAKTGSLTHVIAYGLHGMLMSND